MEVPVCLPQSNPFIPVFKFDTYMEMMEKPLNLLLL